jgi:multidrug transporter EmrE-like cation transporter
MTSPPGPRNAKRPLYLLILNIFCVATAELFLSIGSKGAAGSAALDFAALSSPCTIVGILFHISAFICWMLALRTVPLGLAYNFTAVNQVVVPIAALLFLHERVTPVKWMGITLVVAGFVLLVPLIVRTEEHLEPAMEEAPESAEMVAK